MSSQGLSCLGRGCLFFSFSTASVPLDFLVKDGVLDGVDDSRAGFFRILWVGLPLMPLLTMVVVVMVGSGWLVGGGWLVTEKRLMLILCLFLC